jgi:hypothetical protein
VDVLVVGAGPTGLACAHGVVQACTSCCLPRKKESYLLSPNTAQNGASCLVVDARPDISEKVREHSRTCLLDTQAPPDSMLVPWTSFTRDAGLQMYRHPATKHPDLRAVRCIAAPRRNGGSAAGSGPPSVRVHSTRWTQIAAVLAPCSCTHTRRLRGATSATVRRVLVRAMARRTGAAAGVDGRLWEIGVSDGGKRHATGIIPCRGRRSGCNAGAVHCGAGVRANRR